MSSITIQNQFPLAKLSGSKFPVKASVLHRNLDSGWKFTDWLKVRIEKYGFEKNIDFEVRQPKSCSSSQELLTSKSNTFLTLNMAKELAMVEETEVGRRVRKYFLECERRLLSSKPAGKMISDEYGTKYVPEVPKEEKTIVMVKEAAEELDLDSGKYLIADLDEQQILTGMFHYNERRVAGIYRKNDKISLCLQGKLHVRELKSKYFE